MQPTLSGRTVLLRPLAPSDWDQLYAVASDRELWAVHPAHDRWQEPVFRKLFEQSIASGGALVIVDKKTGTVIGSSRYDRSRAQEGEVEIGWTFLSRAYWGGTTNREVKSLMLEHALPHFARVIFVVGEDNIRSRRAMEKIGGTLTDRTVTTDMAGVPVRHAVYAIDSYTFAASPLAQHV